jgi:acetyl esterase/lipase
MMCAALLALAACSKTDALDFLTPHEGYTRHTDIAYGLDPRQKLDVYLPEKAIGPAPVVLFFYGGGWNKGSKDQYRFVGQAFAEKGYVTVVADYRIFPQVRFPAFLDDGAHALAWVHAHIGEYGGDGENVFLAGHSAGGYIAVMLSVNDRYITAAGGRRDWIRGTVGLAGPYDFLPFNEDIYRDIFSTEKDTLTQPITYAGRGAPPMLLLTGDADDEVRPKNSINLAAKLRANGDKVTLKTYPGMGHVGIVLALAHSFQGKAGVLEDIDGFIRANVSTHAP